MSEKKATVLLEHYLKQLKLPTMMREYASLAATCGQERADYVTYLLRLVERELLDREQRACQRRVKAARFPVIKTLDTFDFKAQPSINQALVRELMSGEYLVLQRDIVIPPGVYMTESH
jgi:DNA replication protein DnaC